jgi:hypothetical protein
VFLRFFVQVVVGGRGFLKRGATQVLQGQFTQQINDGSSMVRPHEEENDGATKGQAIDQGFWVLPLGNRTARLSRNKGTRATKRATKGQAIC